MRSKLAWTAFILLATLSVGVTSATDPGEKRNRTLDARLQRFLQTPALDRPTLKKSLSMKTSKGEETTVDVLIALSNPADLPAIPGVLLRSRIGGVATATVTAGALEMLAEHPRVDSIEPAVRLKWRNDIGTAASSGVSGTILPGLPTVHSYSAQENQSLTLSMHAAPGSALNPFLKICQSSSCVPVLASNDDSGPGTDARLTFVFPSSGTFSIVASDSTGTNGGSYRLVFHDDPSAGFPLGIGAKSFHGASGHQGEGVIVGVVDSGIDWCHPDFIDDTTGKSRILFLWDQNLTAQTDEAAADVGTDGNGANNYGVEYTAAHIDAARDANDCARAIEERAVRSADIIGHGTHVAGIAAGDGSATNGASPEEPAGTYQGVAPKADLIVVNLKGDELGPFSESASTVDAVAYIFAKARAAGKPAVINISLGGHDGPVDGTSLLDQAIRNAAGPGRVIVAAAGNEGAAPIHAQGTISPGGSDTLEINFSGCGAPDTPDCEGGIINLWHAGGDAYAVTVTAPNGHSLSAPGGTRRSAVLDGAQVELFNATSSPSNGDKNILLFLDGRGTGDFVWLLTLQRTASGGSGRWDAWSLPDQGEVAFNIKHLPRNSDNSFSGTISEPATSHGAIAVGAHTTKFRWGPGKASPTAFEDFGKISLFSSGGPTRDGRIKPDVTAPGFVVSSTSADCSGLECPDSLSAFDGRHSINAGTSMSTPIVTGAAALILQTDPNSFPRSFLKSTAVRDSFTGADLPNNVWGSGKANLASSAFQVLQANRPPTVSLGGSPAEGFATSSMTFTASASDPDTGDSISEYLWDFESDGATDAITTGNTAGKNFTVAGSYTVTVTAVDQRGKSASATTPITITAPSSDGGGGGGGGCFIATAAYGSYLDPHVETLRNFRDEVLLESAWGRRFVDFYYGWSPAAARFIAGRPLLRGASRLALTPIVFAVGSPRRALWVFIGGWLALGAVLLRLRRR